MVRFYTFVVVVAASCVHHKCKRKMLRRSSASVSGAEAVGTRLQNEKLKKKQTFVFWAREADELWGKDVCECASNRVCFANTNAKHCNLGRGEDMDVSNEWIILDKIKKNPHV